MDTATSSVLSHVALSELVAHLPSEPHALELFRRAIVLRDDDAWEAIYHRYHHMIFRWIRQHHHSLNLSPQEQTDAVTDVLARFYKSFTADKWYTIESVTQIFGYLHLCATSEITDLARLASYHSVLCPLEVVAEMESHTDEIARAEMHHEQIAFWRKVRGMCKTQQEWIILSHMFLLDLKPGAIYPLHPDVFDSVTRVYHVNRGLMERLRRHRDYFRESEQVS